MPLMPMPPMPTKWIGPMSRGSFMIPPSAVRVAATGIARRSPSGKPGEKERAGRGGLRAGPVPRHLHTQFGHPIRGIEKALPLRRRRHGGELFRIGGEPGDLAGEALRREARLLDRD